MTAVVLTSCSVSPSRGGHGKKKVHSYVTHKTDARGNDILLYWYLMTGNNNTIYYYTSNTPTRVFSNVNWTSGYSKPEELKDIEEEPEEFEIDLDELPEDIVENIDDIDVIESEQVGEAGVEVDDNSASDADDGGSSDGGSSDGGGGDSGGGDGGGGE